MKKVILILITHINAMMIYAQDRKSDTPGTDYTTEKIVGIVLIAGFVIWGLAKRARRK